MKILMVEDHKQYMDLIAQKLRETFDFDVTVATDPLAAHGHLGREHYDAVIVDVLYRRLSEHYSGQRERARNSLDQLRPFNVSGLMTLYEVHSMSRDTALIVWTSADPNRALHLVLAYQAFGIRAFCSKESDYRNIGHAVHAALEGRPSIDLGIQPFLPRPYLPPIGEILFREIKWRAIWRALAAGSSDHDTTARMTHYETQTIRKAMSPMAQELSVLSPQPHSQRQVQNVLSSYATFHWEFFLDRAVVEMFPHTSAKK